VWWVFNFNRTYPIRATGRGTYWGVSGMGDVYKRNQKLVEQIRSGDQYAFEQMFHSYYSKLCVFSNSYVKSLDVSRDVVQEVFIKIWDNREDFTINQTHKAYLYQAVRNQSHNDSDTQHHRRCLQRSLKKRCEALHDESHSELNTEELTQEVWKLVEQLPERRRTISIRYRKHGLSYADIVEVME